MKKLKFVQQAFWVVILALSLHNGSAAQISKDATVQDFADHIETLVPDLLEKYRVPGAAVGFIENGEIAYLNAFGHRDIEGLNEVTLSTVFNIGSISKSMTAWGVLRLVQDGAIDLESPVSKYLPDWSFPHSDYDPDEVTIRRLLSHTAGISMRSAQGEAIYGNELPILSDVLKGEVEGIRGIRVYREPGSGFNYSGGGYGLLQLMIEKVSGRSFGDFMKSNVFDPFGMNATDVQWTEDYINSAALPYNINNKKEPYVNRTISSAAGVQLNIVDFARFAQGHFTERTLHRVLEDQYLDEMFAPTSETGDIYGLGYFREKLVDGQVAIGHDGSNTGWNAVFQTIPEQKSAFVFLTNGSNGLAMTNRMRREWYEWKTGEKAPQEYYNPALTEELMVSLFADGVDAAFKRWTELHEAFPHIRASEGYLNFLGYDLMAYGHNEDAVKLFLLITKLYPESVNAYDSLAEGYVAADNKEKAIESYKQVLKLDPHNLVAKKAIERLGGG